MDRFRAMETFVRVAELGSFTRAADALDLPRATVTAHVQALEAHLGATLLHRTTRRVALTAEGAAYFDRAVRALQALRDAEDEVGGALAAPRGRLRVDVPAAAGRHVIAPALPGFFRRYPHIQLELGSGDRPVDLLDEGVDCVIRGGELHDASLIARRLAVYPVATCAAPAYLRQHGEPTSAEALDDHLFVNFFSAKSGRVYDNDFARDGRRVATRGQWRVAANDADTFVAAAVAGLGLAQLPMTAAVRMLVDAGALRVVLADWRVEPLEIYALWPKVRQRSPRLRAFVEWAAEVYAGEGST